MELNERNKKRILTKIQELVADGELNCEVVHMDGLPFVVVDGAHGLSAIHEEINEAFSPKSWRLWEAKYNGNYRDLRLGTLVPYCKKHGCTGVLCNEGWGCWRGQHLFDNPPENSGNLARPSANIKGMEVVPPYIVPDGLIELDDVCEWGFNDEYAMCYSCGRAIRTSPDSYGWRLDAWLSDEGYLCADCVRGGAVDEYLDDCCSNDTKMVNVCNLVNPEDHGFTMIAEGLEYGLHHGQADDPRKIAAWCKDHDLQVTFQTFPSQFTTTFNVYLRTTDERVVDEVKDDLLVDGRLRREFRQYPDPASQVEKGLKAAAASGSRFTRINGDGTFTAYTSAKEMFNDDSH